jgi:CRP-like cAMP-binding protein
LSNAEVRIGVLAHRGAEQRLGTLLLELAKARAAPAADLKDVIIRLNHEELAQMAAMSRSHVTVTMGRFRTLGLVRYTRDQPIRVNVPALARYLKQAVGTD